MAVYTGDMFHHPSQIEHPEWSPLFDVLPELSAETRRKMFERARRERFPLLTAHLPTPGIARLPRRRVGAALVRRHSAESVLADRSHPIIADRSKLAAVCIDMGSVVVDERPTWSHWQSLAVQHLKQAGLPVGRKELRLALREAMIAHAPRVSSHAFGALGGDPTIPQQIWKDFKNRDRPLPYAARALERLSARHRLVMVANQGLHARALLEAAGLDRYFSLLLLSDEIGSPSQMSESSSWRSTTFSSSRSAWRCSATASTWTSSHRGGWGCWRSGFGAGRSPARSRPDRSRRRT